MINPISADELAEFRTFIAPTVTATRDGKEKLLVTCAGKISCNRCQGTSRWNKLQCGAPALKTSRTQKCKFHGGASTGARTTGGRQRISASLLVHGRETNAVRAERQLKTLELRQLEDILVLIRLGQSNWISAATEIKKWNKAAGIVLKGLTIRRNKEVELLLA